MLRNLEGIGLDAVVVSRLQHLRRVQSKVPGFLKEPRDSTNGPGEPAEHSFLVVSSELVDLIAEDNAAVGRRSPDGLCLYRRLGIESREQSMDRFGGPSFFGFGVAIRLRLGVLPTARRLGIQVRDLSPGAAVATHELARRQQYQGARRGIPELFGKLGPRTDDGIS